MRYKVWQSIWLLALLILLRSGDFGALAAGDDTYNYNQQVIVVLRNDQSTLEAAWYLYGKHPSTSFIVELNNEGLEQVNVKWNEETKLFESVPTEDPPGINHDDWKNTRIQVIGHGIIDSGEETTIGGFQAKDLAIFLIDHLIHGRVMGRISILGCTGKRRDAGTPYTPPELGSDDTPPYLKAFVENLKEDGVKDTTVTMRSALVSVDHSGRKLTGERYPLNEQIHANPEVGIIWTHKDISKSWIGEIKNGEVKYSKKELGDNSEMMPPKYFGILPKDSPLYVSTSETTYGLIDSDALEWVDKEIAQEIYDSIDPAAGPLAETNLEVAFLDGSTEYKNVRVIESAHDLLRELVYFGNKGVELDKRTGMKKGTGDKVFYRFGDWVVSMEMNRFYMNVEGIITTDDGNKEEEENRVKEVRGMWEKYMQKEGAEAIAKYNEIKQQLPESDPEMIRIRDRKAAFEKKILPSDYKNMLLGVGDDFFDNVRSWINGDHSSIGLNIENAYNAQCGLALFMSESIRCFQTHITNMMGLDLAKHGYLTKEYFIETHPMARGKTWVMRKKGTNILETGLEMLRHDPSTKEEKRVEKVFDTTKSLISRIAKSWLSHAEVIGESVLSHDCPNCLEGSTNSPTEGNLDTSEGAKVKLFQKLSTLKTIGSGPPSQEFLRDYDLTKPLLSTKITEPEVGSVKTQVTQFSNTEDISSPLRASMALANDHAYVSNEISKEVQQKEKETGKVYEVVPDSVTVDEIGDSLSFQVYDKNYPASEAEEVKTTIDKTKLESKAFMDDLETKANELQAPENPEGKLSKINRGLAIYGVVSGLGGAISSFEDGNITQGMIGMSQSLHGIGELSGVNRAIYKAAGKFLGRILRSQVESVSDMVSTVAGEDTGKLFSLAGGELLSTIGDVGDFLEDVPIVGTAFGIYNIYEDFQQHSVLGYIDAGLDSAITGLSFLGPEAEPVIMALTVIRMGIGAFYNDISKELKNLPPDASVSEKVGAVFKGIGEAFLDLWEEFSLPGMIFGAIKNSHELDKEYDHDREFLRNLSNYKNYFTIEGSGAKEINFAGGSESWNGGDITFHLGEPGEDSILTVEDVDSNGKLRNQTATFDTSGVQDIIMGIGESHKIRFKKHTVKFLWFIPVHSRTLISGNTSLTDTLHGSYSGNSKDNKFIAVQQLPPNTNSLGYSLQDYHYKLFGREGNDAFYLGPQRSYAEGNDGSDTYYVNTTSVNAEINNYATDKKTDYMILNLDYDQLIPNRKGLDVQITTSNERHNILIDNWFHSDTYQHMIFKTEDGVLFKISATGTGGATFIPYALTGIASEKSVELDARKSDLSRVVTLIGSDHDDVLYGNDQDNQLNGGKGDDTLTGGEGKDTYTIHANEGKDTINNYAKDGKTDILFFPAKFDDIKGSSDSSNDDVILSGKGSEGATIKNWFSSPIYRHMLAVSDDGVVFNVSHTKETTVKLQPIMVDMALMQPSDSCQDYNGLCYHRVINLTADPLLHDIVTVLGSDERDMIVGNFKNNYITAGKGVVDIIIGGEGQDTYAFKRTDEDYSITNVARDQSVDALLFDNDFHDIELSAVEGTALAIRNNKQNAGQVVLQCWFRCDDCMLTSEPMRHHLPFFHHLLVRSIDGVVFELPTDSEHVVKIPRLVDKSKQLDGVYLDLSNETFSMVQRVLGSQGKDIIQGNSLSNYIDPGVGGCYVEGRNGSDTYVIQDGYGEDNTINNYAEDERPDTLLFRAPFFTIDAKVCGNSKDLRLTSEASGFSTMLSNYTSDPKYRHLMVISEDGYSFVLPAVSNYKPVPIIINRARTTTGQHINLTSNATFSEVITVYGSNTYQNCIIGNQKKNTLIGGSEDDLLIGNGGNDVIKGGAGMDTLQGGPGDDTLVGGAGNDRLEGGDGDDIMAPGLGSNVVDGGNGSDTVIYIGRSATGVDLDLQGQFCQENLFGVELQMPDDTTLPGFERDKLHSIENAYGTEYGDWLYGNDEDNVLVGLGGNDVLLPGTGYDILNGGKGNDTYLLDSAKGTVTIVNYATDGALDKASMTYANMADLRYEKVGNDLVVRSIDIRYPVFFDEQQPTVIFKDWFVDSVLYHHIYIQANDGMIKLETLEREGKKAEERNMLSMEAKN